MTIISYTADGRVAVVINRKRYEYFVDAVHVQPILKMAKHHPWKALNELKKRNRLTKSKLGGAEMEKRQSINPLIQLNDRVEKYDLTVSEIMGKLSLEFMNHGLGLLLYEIETVLGCSSEVARELYEQFIKEKP